MLPQARAIGNPPEGDATVEVVQSMASAAATASAAITAEEEGLPVASRISSASRTSNLAVVTPIFPPRPDAIMTLLASDEYLPGAQTLLYSIKKHLVTDSRQYPPELVVLVTPNVKEVTRQALFPALCTRMLQVDPIEFPQSTLDTKIIKRKEDQPMKAYDDHSPGLTKLSIFQFQNYDTVLYIDVDCLVLQDISKLLDLGKVYTESEALIAAAPDMFPPDKFNSGVLVVRPSTAVFENMLGQAGLLTTYDSSDTGFLNAYFPQWFTEMPPLARLGFEYNAQRALYEHTYTKYPNYWDVGVGPNLQILHYSSTPKPWETLEQIEGNVVPNHHQHGAKDLDSLWRTWYQKSKNYMIRHHREAEDKSRQVERQLQERAQAEQQAAEARAKDPKVIHKLIAKRFKELRLEGKSSQVAMEQARAEYQPQQQEVDAGTQVAAMFGMM